MLVTHDPNQLLTLGQAARSVGVKKCILRKAIFLGQIKPTVVRDGKRLFQVCDVGAWFKNWRPEALIRKFVHEEPVAVESAKAKEEPMSGPMTLNENPITDPERFYIKDLTKLTGFSPGWINWAILQGKLTGATIEVDSRGVRRYFWPYNQLGNVAEQAKQVRKLPSYHRKAVEPKNEPVQPVAAPWMTWLKSGDVATKVGLNRKSVCRAALRGYLRIHHRGAHNEMFFSRSAVHEWRNGLKQRLHDRSIQAGKTRRAREAGFVPEAKTDDRIITRKMAAKLVGCSPNAIYQATWAKNLKVHHRGATGKDYYLASDVLAWREGIKRRRHDRSVKANASRKGIERLPAAVATAATPKTPITKTRTHLLGEAEQVVDGKYSPVEFLRDVRIYRGRVDKIKADIDRLHREAEVLADSVGGG